MAEIEIKLQVPAAAVAPLVAYLRGLGARGKQMRAAYFDTTDRALAAKAMAWRVRREGRQWVQTLKAGQGVVREEHNVIVPGPAGLWPMPEPTRHRGSAAGAQLESLLLASTNHPVERFRTDFLRLSVPIRTRRGVVELSLDRGRIVAGSETLPICELEIELLSGAPLAICDVARRLINRHGLWLDLRSKAHRGHLLADGKNIAPAQRSRAVSLPTSLSPADAWTLCLDECAAQILGNASQIAAFEGFTPEHVRQLRVGLRRWRTAIRLFDATAAGTLAGASVETRRRLIESAATLARALGTRRDRDVMAQRLWPELERSGAPLVALPIDPDQAPPAVLIRSGAVQDGLLSLIEAQQVARAPSRVRRVAPRVVATGDAASLTEATRPIDATVISPITLVDVLRRWLRSARRQAGAYSGLNVEQRHRLRRRLKRLRYGIEFALARLPERKTRALLKSLADAQEVLGEFNDLHVALESYRNAAQDDPRAWYAVGWLSAQLPSAINNCRKALERFERVSRAWAKGLSA